MNRTWKTTSIPSFSKKKSENENGKPQKTNPKIKKGKCNTQLQANLYS